MPMEEAEPNSRLRDHRLWLKELVYAASRGPFSFGVFIYPKTKTYRFAPALVDEA